MKIRETKEYILDLEEIRLINSCLDYILHRKIIHQKPKNISLDAVNKLRDQLKKTKNRSKKIMKILCKIGLHDKQFCSAPYVLEGIIGEIRTWVCKKCGYKHTKGVFVRDGENCTQKKKDWAEVEDMKNWK